MATMTRQLIEDSPHAVHLDEAVDEVFRLMMGVQCIPGELKPPSDTEMLTAVIGLAGAISGACLLSLGRKSALRIAEFLTGVQTTEMDTTVKDAVGEVCNMIAGAWKGKYAPLSSGCMLSIPAIVTGSNYQLHMQSPEFSIERCYQFEDQIIDFKVICESIQ
ncbi:MAG: chemotaxis protein CheX [Acidobacteria bacterium]|nr:chemotaxis protein CheX [Acidobacteriota bacterium]